MKRSTVIFRATARLLLFALVFAVPVLAADPPDLPLTMPTAGKFACPTCLTESAGVNAIADGDLPNLTSSQWAGHVTDETGSGAMCFANSPSLTTPSIAGATLTGTINASGSTMQLPADAVDAIGEIADAILGGSPHGAKLATQESAPTASRCARFDSNGVLVAHSSDCGGTAIAPPIFIGSQFPIPAGDVNTFMDLDGNISATSAEVQSVVNENMTIGGCVAVYRGTPGTSLVVTLASGTYGGALSDSTIAITLGTNNTPVSDADTLALTANQGVNWKIDGASGTGEGQLRITCKRTA